MRVQPLPFALLAVLALASTAVAQDPDGEPGCAQSNPCEVILELDSNGIADLAPDTFGTGDWILFSIYNADDQTHTVRLDGHQFEASVTGGDLIDTQPFKLGAPGSYDLTDLPSHDTAPITVEENEVFTGSAGGSSSKSGGYRVPALSPVLVVGLLAAIAMGLRRK
ncbi:MAG: hypothetical protein QOC71_68 [Thermoplasmata archaeon]|jgi:hypothetical protein|nr:hypothetical protein [Thermoplasmata archaeon]